MGKTLPHDKVKLIFGFLFKDGGPLAMAESLIAGRYGPVDFESATMDFTHTEYYRKEFGCGLKRKFISLKRLVCPERIYTVKLASNRIERDLSARTAPHAKTGRSINIDPGYVTPSKLVLATTKDAAHRVYLGMGIYAESTLLFKKGRFEPHERTYPDYRTDFYRAFFEKVRTKLMVQA